MELPDNVTITGIANAVLQGTRSRVIGRNSHRPVQGQEVREPVVRLYTDAGVSGWGWSPAAAEDADRLVGKRLDEVFSPETGTRDEYLAFDFPLWDLAGQVLAQPVHSMLGDAGAGPVAVYDGSIYIDELDPETGGDEGVEPMLYAVNVGLDVGFNAFKVKVGRGLQWMKPEAGLKRDIEVIHAIRDLIGPHIKLLIDANNGYTPEEARRIMREAGECDIFWFEEPFPESIEDCVAFKEFMREGGWSTLLADGETRSTGYDEEFEKIVRAGGIDVVQFDLRRYTLTRWLRYMQVIDETDTLAAPHNWGSHLSGFYIPQFARGFQRFAMGETDDMAMPGVQAEGYDLKEGMRSVPDTPGFGLELKELYFTRAQRVEGAWVVGAA